ncbi:MAG TPA: VOC family protein [Solirubrobacteraceae bacterium]|nr:VOC family protein [Solirubrobacteraceae bacterium]
MNGSAIDPGLRVGSVTLAVSDLQRSVDFYERMLGLPLLERSEDEARLGTDAARPALVLTAIADPEPVPVDSTGLFHVAWLHPSRAALAATIRRIIDAGWRFDGASDHGVSEALYLSDPDGLGIEIYADRPREAWERPAEGHGVRMMTLPLDVEDLLAQGDPSPTPAIAPGTGVGHVHMKVADVPRAAAFYGGTLGFEEMAQMPSAAFLSAGGYHHHLGLNSWQSAGASRAPESAPGLQLVEFELPGEDALGALERVLAARAPDALLGAEGGRVSVLDPDGQELAFAAP